MFNYFFLLFRSLFCSFFLRPNSRSEFMYVSVCEEKWKREQITTLFSFLPIRIRNTLAYDKLQATNKSFPMKFTSSATLTSHARTHTHTKKRNKHSQRNRQHFLLLHFNLIISTERIMKLFFRMTIIALIDLDVNVWEIVCFCSYSLVAGDAFFQLNDWNSFQFCMQRARAIERRWKRQRERDEWRFSHSTQHTAHSQLANVFIQNSLNWYEISIEL